MTKKILYFSSWIENFGVVPLFLFLAFLFLPTFDFLFLLLLSVTAVRETISKILTKLVLFFNNPKCLPSLRRTVKIILFLIIMTREAQSSSDIIISKGEVKELKTPIIKKLTIGNSEIISQTPSPKNDGILLKGKMVGYTELKIWTHSDRLLSFHIHVLKKAEHLSINQILNALKPMGLKVKFEGPQISVEGAINKEKDRRNLIFLLKKYKTLLNSTVEISDELKKNIIEKVISIFSKSGVDQIECQEDFINLICFLPPMEKNLDELKKYISNEYGVKFLIKERIDLTNYLLKLKIIQIEKQNGDSIGLNLDYNPDILMGLFKTGLKKYLDLNNINFDSHNLEVSTLAEPEILTLIGKKSQVEVGAEIPFFNKNENRDSIIWKFAGIKAELELEKYGNHYQLSYKTQMTKPFGDSSISGNKESSTAIIELQKPIQLFQIGFKTEGIKSDGFPLIQNIPLLREIFGSSSSHSTYKRITGFLLLEEYDGRTKH